ncbi:hypothetical protein QJS66_11870 [Kocuria rhizophila]|nr:hypothetical protein QJS66_11870 [Kocuria rhizophila]
MANPLPAGELPLRLRDGQLSGEQPVQLDHHHHGPDRDQVVLGVLTAYAFASRVPGWKGRCSCLIASLTVPSQITIISNYALVAESWAGADTFQGIIPLAGVAFGTFSRVPLPEACPARSWRPRSRDGTGFLRKLFRVVLPMSWPR